MYMYTWLQPMKGSKVLNSTELVLLKTYISSMYQVSSVLGQFWDILGQKIGKCLNLIRS